jgi:protein-tyrosine phosphatase
LQFRHFAFRQWRLYSSFTCRKPLLAFDYADRFGRSQTMKQILFLCSGNYYRSRFAEIYFNWHAKKRCLNWKAESRGLTLLNIHPGFMFQSTIARFAYHDIPIDSYKRLPLKATQQDFDAADHIVAMKETEHRPVIEERFTKHLERVEFWEIHDIDCAGPEEMIPHLEHEVLALIERLENSND